MVSSDAYDVYVNDERMDCICLCEFIDLDSCTSDRSFADSASMIADLEDSMFET